MAEKRTRGRAERADREERCVFCRLSERLDKGLGKHAGVLDHLENARREVLQAVREFVDVELETVEKALRERKSKRKGVTRIEVKD